MHLKIVVFLLLVLCQLGKRFLSQLTTAGYMYELVAGQDSNDDVSASAKFTAYFDCWQDDSCLYVAKEKSSGKFLLKKAGEIVNNDDYSAVWKKNTVDIDECISSPCRNGTCVDRISGYHCICNPGFNGTHCEIVKDNCVSNPCQFYERCVSGVNMYYCETLTNVALYKKATQSSTHQNWAGAFIAQYAVDGNNNPDLFALSCTHTSNSPNQNPWWEVDFGKFYNITGVEITNRGGCCGERLRNFAVTVDSDLCFNRSEQIPQGASVKLPCSSVLKGQRLKIQLQYKGVLTLCEVKVFTPDQDINECLSNPCQNGGTCIDFYNRYSCQCAAGFTGISCQGS